MLADLPLELRTTGVIMDCGELTVSTSSFWDEMVKEILEVREAQSLSVVHASPRAAELARRAAENRGVAARLSVEVRPAA
jgi:hypothetical protein